MAESAAIQITRADRAHRIRYDQARALARRAGRRRCGATSPRPSFGSSGSWAAPTLGADSEFELLNDHDNLSDDDVPYPEDYATSKGRAGTRKSSGSSRPGCSKRPSRAARTAGHFELFPEGDRSRLVITHSGISSPTGFQDFGGGWNSHMIVLQERLAGRGVKDFWALHAQSRERGDGSAGLTQRTVNCVIRITQEAR